MTEISTPRSTERSLARARPWPARLPMAIPGGLLLLFAGAAVDIGHHAGLALASSDQFADAGHLVTLGGMLLTLAGVLRAGLQRRR